MFRVQGFVPSIVRIWELSSHGHAGRIDKTASLLAWDGGHIALLNELRLRGDCLSYLVFIYIMPSLRGGGEVS